MDPEADGAEVRDATAEDAAACAAIYAHHVEASWATFELDAPSAAEVAERIAAAQRAHAWLVLVRGGDVVGYACGTAFRARPAYRWSCEVSAYLHPDHLGTGGGRALYAALLGWLAARGLRTATAAIALPNPASLALHAAMGFSTVGTFTTVGYKLGAWRDVRWVQRSLVGEGGSGDAGPPPEPV